MEGNLIVISLADEVYLIKGRLSVFELAMVSLDR